MSSRFRLSANIVNKAMIQLVHFTPLYLVDHAIKNCQYLRVFACAVHRLSHLTRVAGIWSLCLWLHGIPIVYDGLIAIMTTSLVSRSRQCSNSFVSLYIKIFTWQLNFKLFDLCLYFSHQTPTISLHLSRDFCHMKSVWIKYLKHWIMERSFVSHHLICESLFLV